MKKRYNHMPIVTPLGASDNVRNLVLQMNAALDDVYNKIGNIVEALKELQQGDESDVNENDEL